MKHHIRHILATIIFLWGVIALTATTDVQAQERLCRVQLLQSATVSAVMVSLKDIAQIWAQNEELKERLGKIEIVRAPLAGQSRWIMKDQVEKRLKQFGLNPPQYHLSSNGPTEVRQPSATLSAQRIRAAVDQHIRTNAPWPPEQLKIGAIKFKRDLRIPVGKVLLGVRTPKHSDWLGAVLFNVDVQVNGQLIQKISVPANIEVWSDVVLAAKPLGKFQPISSSAIKVVRMNLARVPGNAILDVNEIIGQRAKRNIAVNSVLRSDQIEMPPMVKRGDRVQAIAVSPSLRISVQAVVKEDGGKGETIRVLNLRSKKIIYAQVVDAQTVSVEF